MVLLLIWFPVRLLEQELAKRVEQVNLACQHAWMRISWVQPPDPPNIVLAATKHSLNIKSASPTSGLW